MKRFFALFLCTAILIGGLYIPAAAMPYPGIYNPHFTDASAAESVQNAIISFDANLEAIRIAAAEDGTVNANVQLAKAAEGNLDLVFWVPATNKPDATLTITCGNWNNTYTDAGGHRFERYTYSGVTGDVLNITFDGAATDSIYVYIATGEVFDEFYWSFFMEMATANCDLTEEELFLNAYEVDRYTKEYWGEIAQEKIVYNESFFVLANEDGTVDPIQLMYDVNRVVSVQNSYLNKEYVYGVDYTIEDGKLVILPDGNITPYKYSYVFRNTAGNSWWEMLDGGYVFGGQQGMFMTGYLNITYTYADTSWFSPKPEAKGYLLDKTLTKLENGETVKMLTVGDSITGGANCSGSSDVNAEPHADIWHEMAAKKLQMQYPDATVEYQSIYQGGATAQLCIDKMDDILAIGPDLIVIEFGVNDCMQGDPASLYIETLQKAIAAIQENLPDCDIILVSPLISNPLIFPTEWFDAYADALYPLEEEGVAVADVTSMMRGMLTRKRYLDMTGDNLCHPNDFVSRLFAQTLVATLSRDTDISDFARRLRYYRFEDEYYPQQWQEVQALIEEGTSAIMEKRATPQEAAAILLEYKGKINQIETKKQIDAEAVLDTASLIFDTKRAMDAVTEPTMVYKKYDPDEKALVATVSGRNPILYFDYTAGDQPVNADDYDYLVLTVKAESRKTNVHATVRYQMQEMDADDYLDDITVPLTLDEAYHSYIVDLTGLTGWTGTVKELALNLFNTSVNNDTMYVSSIILCDNETSAQKVAGERERIANKEPAPAITNLFDSDTAAGALQSDITYLRGDIDNDGTVSALDALELAKYLADANADYTEKWRLDVDGDKEILTSDSLQLKKILAGISEGDTLTLKTADVSFDAGQDAAKIETRVEDATLQIDVSNLNCSADTYKYLTLCLKAANAQAFDATVTVTTDTSSQPANITFGGDTLFEAGSCGFANITGTIQSISITFHIAAGECIYLDSYVLTASAAAAQNAEIVRVGAANLIQ